MDLNQDQTPFDSQAFEKYKKWTWA